mmetsp:Transcript_45609/g.97446  ORF Transcript_45609/g.97446 Transcript_45609/m.97446 type:complete len:213 (-) Transcript_45609:124-762(-)
MSKRLRTGEDCTAPQADVKVIVEGETFWMYSQVLALSSPVFARMLDSSMIEGQTKTIEMPGKSKKAFKQFQSFMHPIVSGRGVKVDEKTVDDLLPLFSEYQIDSMIEECEKVLLTMPVSIHRLIQADRFGLKGQRKRCMDDIGLNPSKMFNDEIAKHPEIMKEFFPILKIHFTALSNLKQEMKQWTKNRGYLTREGKEANQAMNSFAARLPS